MTDGSQNQSLETYERNEQIKQWKEAAAQRAQTGEDVRFQERPEPQLVIEPIAMASSSATAATHSTEPPKTVDPETSYRHARLAVTAVIALVLFFIWIKQRRKH